MNNVLLFPYGLRVETKRGQEKTSNQCSSVVTNVGLLLHGSVAV